MNSHELLIAVKQAALDAMRHPDSSDGALYYFEIDKDCEPDGWVTGRDVTFSKDRVLNAIQSVFETHPAAR